MAKNTAIPWCTATWNWCIGCDKVSDGCLNCYAEAWCKRTGTTFKIHRASHATFIAPTRWHDPKVIFPCSLSDFLHPGADEWREEAWQIIRNTPHTYLILTKRPERFEEVLAKVDGWPLPNVWLGVTVENQKVLEERLAPLLSGMQAMQAAGHFVSCEPLLGEIDLSGWLPEGLNWVIVGGESGSNARPMLCEWVDRILNDASVYGIPAFVKQMSQYHNGPHYRNMETWSPSLRVQETPEALNVHV